MKTAHWALLAFLSLAMPCLGQALAPSSDWSVTDRGENFRIWSRTFLATNTSGGEATVRAESFTELTPGASRWEAGRWVEAAPQLVVTNNGVLGIGAQWSAFFAANLNSRASAQVVSPRGPALKIHILGLVYQDRSTGTNIWLARLKDSVPRIVGSNQVVYMDAFEGALCDVRYTYGQSGVAQDVIVKEALPSPSEWGLEPTNTHLVVVSEVVEGPTPAKRERAWRSGQEVMRDQTLDFGSGMVMVPGRAFDLKDTSKRRGLPVAKQFEVVDGRSLIAERVRYSQVQAALAQLPPPGMSLTNLAGAVTTNTSNYKLKRWLAQGALPPAPKPMQPAAVKIQRVASLGSQPGFVLDWELMSESFDWHFSCKTNYLIGSKVHLANAVFEPQTRIRYAPGAALFIDGALTCLNASACGGSGPALLTSINDEAEDHGGPIAGWSSGAPSPGEYGPALVVRPEDLATAQNHFAVYYAQPAILSGATAPTEVTVVVTNWAVARGTTDHATFTIQRDYGDWSQPLTVQFQVRTNFGRANAVALQSAVTIPANQESVAVPVPFPAESATQYETTVTLALSEDAASAYSLGEPRMAAVSAYNASAAASTPVVAPQGLVAWWRAENNALDSFGSNHGQLLNGLGFGPGEVGQGFSFDGVDDRMTVASSTGALDFGSNADFSIEAWIYPIQGNTTYGVQAIVDKRYTPDSSRAVGYTLYLVNGRLGFQFADAPLSYSYSGYGPAGPDLRDSRFHHVAVTLDRHSTTGGKLYVDGVQVMSFPNSEPGDLSNTDPLRIGNHAQANFNGNFKGVIDEVSLYNRALSAAEIQSIYNAGSGGKAIPPAIVTQPISQTVNQGANVALSVTATGTAPLSYQWMFKGTNIAGATASSYTRNNVQATDAGTYAVRVANAVGSVTSRWATLTVLAAPMITTQPVSQTVTQGANVTFSVGVAGTLPLSFHWTFNGTNLWRATGSSFVRSNAQPCDAGLYAVVITNSFGRVTTSNAVLTVLVPPKVTQQPSRQTVCAGSRGAAFTVAATGTAPLAYQWYKDGVAIYGATRTDYSLGSVFETNAGTYSVLVTNVAGAVSSSGAYLLVGQSTPAVSITPDPNRSQYVMSLDNGQAEQFISVISSNGYANNHPTTLTVQAPYSDALYGHATGCSDSMSRGINLSKLPVPLIESADGTIFNYPSNVVIRLGQEDLSSLVANLYPTELGRAAQSSELATNMAYAQSLRTNGFSDEDIRSRLINNFRRSAEYASRFGGPGQTYQPNRDFIEYSLDGGTNWSTYINPIPVAGTCNLLARAGKKASSDARTYYAYVTSEVVSASFSYLPAGWLERFWGTNYASNADAGPGADPDYDQQTNLEEYQKDTNPVFADNGGPAANFFQADSPEDLINVQFATNACAQFRGPAAAGFDPNDYWNRYDPDNSQQAWRQGVDLYPANWGASKVRLWGYVGPFWASWPWGVPGCYEIQVYDQSGWRSYWDCYADAMFPFACEFDFNAWYSSGNGIAKWIGGNYWWGLFRNMPESDALYWWSWLWAGQNAWRYQIPMWAPAFDKPYLASPPRSDLTDLAAAGLTSFAQNEMLPWLEYCGLQHSEVPGARLYLTGMTPGQYRLFLYGPSKATVNGRSGMRKQLRPNSAQMTVPYTEFTVAAYPPGKGPIQLAAGQPPYSAAGSQSSSLNWTNDPFPLSKTEARIEIDFEGIAKVTGLQLVRFNASVLPAPTPAAVPGQRAVYLSWPAVRMASSYQVYRSTAANGNFSCVASTTERAYADTHLAPSTTYYYYVVASNPLSSSPPSTPPVGARTFGATNQPPITIYPPWDDTNTPPLVAATNSAPALNRIDPIALAAQPDGSFQVPFVKLLAASDAWDPDGDPLSFRVTAAVNGRLTINGAPFDASHNCIFDSHAVVVWTPSVLPLESELGALEVSAFDGSVASATSVPVTLVPIPPTCLLGWGRDRRGSLGNGWYEHDSAYDIGKIRLSPERVKLGHVLSAAHDNDALGAAVTADGNLWMWGCDYGSGVFGQGQTSFWDTNSQGLAYAQTLIKATPFQVQMFGAGTKLEDFTNVVDVSLGWGSVLALRADGTLWSWGESQYGQLGRTVNPADVIPLTLGWTDATKKAGQIKGFSGAVVQAIADGTAGLALCEDGSVWWWGTMLMAEEDRFLTPDGQFHLGPSRLTAFDNGSRVVQIAGDLHYVALCADGSVWEFGYVPRLAYADSPAQIRGGGSARYFSKDPIQVTNFPPGLKVTSVCADWDYGLALMDDKTVYAWGALGDPWSDMFSSPDPVPVPGLSNIVKIALYGTTAMALDEKGQVWAWGGNDQGQLGVDPSTEAAYVLSPQPVSGVENATHLIPAQICAFAIANVDEGRPTGLRATPLNQSVRLDWRVYPGADSYKVYRALTNEGSYTMVGSSGQNSFTDKSDLVNGVTYFYCVSAVTNTAETLRSASTAATPIPPPGQPIWHVISDGSTSSLAVFGTCRSIHLQWDRVDQAAEYKVYRTGSSSTNLSTLVTKTKGLSCVDESAQAGATYFYFIVAANSAGDSPASALSLPVHLDSASCPPAPVITRLSMPTNGWDGLVQVTWRQVAVTNGANIIYPESYNVKWEYNFHNRKPGADTYFMPRTVWVTNLDNFVDGAGQTNFSYILGYSHELPSDQLVWFKVSALIHGEEGADSSIAGPILPCYACNTNTPPANLAAVPGYRQVYLQWDDTSLAAYYELQYRTNSNDPNWLIASDHITENRFWHTNLVNGATYEYQVRSLVPVYNQDSNYITAVPSPFSGTASATPLDSLHPANLSFTAKADAFDRFIYVHWESLTNQPPLQCFVERKLAADTNGYAALSDTGYGLAYLDSDVVNGQTYSYRVTALDANYHRFCAETSATPLASGFLNVVPTAGNAHVVLNWTSLNAARYQVKHSLQPGGPYEIVATVTTGTTFRHEGIQNGIQHYYSITALMPYEVSFDSPEVQVLPLGSLRPLPPASLQAQVGCDTNGQSQILFSWAPSGGAINYALSRSSGPQLYYGPATSLAYQVPVSITDGQELTFQVTAFSSAGYPSDPPTQVTFTYNAQTRVANDQVLLAIGGHDVLADNDQMKVTGPTNLVLTASVKAPGASDAQIYFYDTYQGNQNVIGVGQGPVAQITWFQVPQGIHYVMAQAITQPPNRGFFGTMGGGGTVYNSSLCVLDVKLVPELATYQTAATDLQLPAPGLPITLSRSYDSRNTNSAGCLGKGWSASWDEASLQIANPLEKDWIEVGISAWSLGRYQIAETASHLVTVTLPGGATVYFSAQLGVPGWSNPLQGAGTVSLDFSPFASNQGFLSCDAAPNSLFVIAGDGNNDNASWDGSPLWLVIDPENPYSGFRPSSFTYTAPEGTRYLFTQVGPAGQAVWKLVQVIDLNGNFLTNTYTSTNLTSIQHGNGRQVQFDYVPGSATDVNGASVNGTWIHVYDSLATKDTGGNPAIKYFVRTNAQGSALMQVAKLVDRSGTYETTQYVYGDSTAPANQDRLIETYDARGVRVLRNEYGVNPQGLPDGRLLRQIDALLHTNSFGLDAHNTLVVTNTVNGTNETVTVRHTLSGAIASVQGGYQGVTNTYDTRGRLVAQADAYGKIKVITYDSQDRPVSQSDPLGHTTSTEFNYRGQPLNSIDANGNTNSFIYDDNGNQVAAVDPSGTWTETAYADPITIIQGSVTNVAAAGLVAAQTNYAAGVPYLVVTRYTYYNAADANASNLKGELKSVVEEAEEDGEVLTNSPATITSYQYDANGNRTNETRLGTVNGADGVAIVTSYIYDAQNRVIRTIDPLGRTNSTSYNKLGKQAATTDPLGRVTSYTYDALGNLLETQYPDGTVSRSTYDEKNRVIFSQERSVPATNGQVTLTTAPATMNVYDAAGKVIRVERRSAVVLSKQPAVRGTDYQGTANAEPQYRITVSGAGSFVSCTRTAYDRNGRVQYSMEARGTVTESIYDDAGRRTTNLVYTAYTVNPLDTGSIVPPSTNSCLTNAYGYDPNGNQIWVRDALGRQTDYEFDEMNRLTRTWFPLVSTDAARKSRTTVYDGLGRKIRETDEAGVSTAFSYDYRGLLNSVILDSSTTNSLTTTYIYDQSGNQKYQIDANGHTTQFQYDQLDRRTKRILPDGTATETTAYTDVPETTGSSMKVQQTAVTDFRGKIITTTLDRLGRLKTKLLPAINNGEASTTISYSYSDIGLLSRVDMSGNVLRTNYFAYDDLRRLTQKDTPEGVLAYAYTNSDLQTIKAYRRNAVPPNGAIPGNATPDVNLGYAYDNLGRLQSVTNNSIASSNVTTYHYDAVGNLDYFIYPNGVKHAYSYTEQNRLRALTLTHGDNSLLRSYTYDLNRAGHRTGVNETNLVNGVAALRQMVAYEYDQDHCYGRPPARVYRLTQESLFDAAGSGRGTIAYCFDSVGNRLQRQPGLFFTPADTSLSTYQNRNYDRRDQLVGATYDANGNTVTGEGSTSIDHYDAENHLIGRDSTIQVGYDDAGNRAWKRVNGVTTYYLLDDRNPSGYVQVLAEYSNLGNAPDRSYAYGLGLVSEQLAGGTLRYYGYDGQGSVRMLLDAPANPASVTEKDTYDYDAYGLLVTVVSNTPNNYLYTGQQWDWDLGMYYLRARYYQPQTGRFWTMDTFEGRNQDPLSLNKYIYCAGNPVNLIDPSGHESQKTIMGKQVHKKLGEEFTRGLIKLRFSGPSIATIGKDIGLPIPDKIEVLFPDLLDATRKEVYEIKPLTPYGLATGFFQALGYISLLNKIDPSGGWHLGNTWSPPSFLILPPTSGSAGGVAYISPPVGGVIFYEAVTIQQIAKRGNRTVRSSQRSQLQQEMGIATILSTMGGF